MGTHLLRAAILAIALAVSVGACGAQEVEPASAPSTPTPAAPAPGAPATVVTGRMVARDAGTLMVDEVAVLDGQAAVDAAHEDGELPESETSLPNDVYVRDLRRQSMFDVAAHATTRLYDCTAGCELVEVDTDAFLSGATLPFGGENAVVQLMLDDADIVVAISEVYLP